MAARDSCKEPEDEETDWNAGALEAACEVIMDSKFKGLRFESNTTGAGSQLVDEIVARLSAELESHFERINSRMDEMSRSLKSSAGKACRGRSPLRCSEVSLASRVREGEMPSPRDTDRTSAASRHRQEFLSSHPLSLARSFSQLSSAVRSSTSQARTSKNSRTRAREMLTTRTASTRRLYSVFKQMEESSFLKAMPVLLLVGSVFSFLQTIPGLGLPVAVCWIIDIVLDGICLLETLVRMSVTPTILLFLMDTYNILDLCGVLVLVLRIVSMSVFGVGGDTTLLALTITCIAPLVRLLRTVRYFEKFNLLLNAFSIALEALPVLLFVQAILILLFSSVIFLLEHKHNPDIDTLPKSLWFALVTMMTVGYGDVVPVTTLGNLVASALMICGGLYNAIPFGIVGSAFGQVWNDRDRALLMHRFRQCLISGGYTAEDIPDLFRCFDRHGSGELDVEDFATMIREMKIGINENRLVELFNVFDDDASGSIDSSEFVKTLFPSAYIALFGLGRDESS